MSKVFKQEEVVINGRHAWLYLVETEIGDFPIVQYEKESLELERKVYPWIGDYEKALKFYKQICKAMLASI